MGGVNFYHCHFKQGHYYMLTPSYVVVFHSDISYMYKVDEVTSLVNCYPIFFYCLFIDSRPILQSPF
jgi:hypothetical protein